MNILPQHSKLIYGTLLFLCLMPFVSPAIALTMGLVLSVLGVKNTSFSKLTSPCLQGSIVLMGFGMQLSEVIVSCKSGFLITTISVVSVMCVGILLGKWLRVDSKIGLLISAGTAICGGSAIAAIAPVIQAKNHQISFSLVVVFVLNAVALILFPVIGHAFNLSQETFGQWAAIAIHDTSSVVGAGAIYGEKALQVATTVKLIRALWIIPLSLTIAFVQKDKQGGKAKMPWFIALFVLSICAAYFLPHYQETFTHLNWLGKRGMIMALFLIGSSVSVKDIKQAGFRSFFHGILLWAFIAVGSFIVLTRCLG